MEDENPELKFVCKLCDKRYPCGKSLGGHVRSHLVVNSAVSDKKDETSLKKFGSLLLNEQKINESANGQSSYVLRENPRKTWRAVGSSFTLQQEKACKQCGKGFQSLKGLCGHMACHSDWDKGTKADHSWTSDSQKLEMHSHSDSEEFLDQIIRKRSFKSKKRIDTKCSSFSVADNGYSSSVSEIDGDEQEVAMCLMMLSRDLFCRCGLNSVVDSSDNNSVIFETKSSSIGTKTGNMDALLKSMKNSKLNDWESEIAQMDDSDSGYFLDECGKVESKLSINRWYKSSPFVKYNMYDAEYRQSIIRSTEGSQKRSKYQCFNCNKVFKSYQALGGHRPCHKRSNDYYESSENSLDDSTELDRKPSGKTMHEMKNKAKQNKGHACPFCDRVFKNGQALGGHKRSHFIGRNRNIRSRNRNLKVKRDLLDLNLPAPEEAAEDRDLRFSGG